MFTTIKKKLTSRRGFTLVEMLCAIVVLLLATGLITLLTDVGLGAYDDSVSYSEAQSLCQTLTSVACADLRGYTYDRSGSESKQHHIEGRGYVVAELKNGTLKLYDRYEETSSMKGQLYVQLQGASQEALKETATHKKDSDNYDEKLALVPSASYTYGITAGADITYTTETRKNQSGQTETVIKYFTLTVTVYGSDGDVLSTNTMDVKPLKDVILSVS